MQPHKYLMHDCDVLCALDNDCHVRTYVYMYVRRHVLPKRVYGVIDACRACMVQYAVWYSIIRTDSM